MGPAADVLARLRRRAKAETPEIEFGRDLLETHESGIGPW
jgi:hypothetical protein